ncbi:unnamed protein product [Spodoptera exigua]|nr:unnamed protein product [Spodoptera exigua]
MKPTCGPVPFPDYSCEDVGISQGKPSLLADTISWQITKEVPGDELSQPFADQLLNQAMFYGELSDYGSTSVNPPVFGQEENMFLGEEAPYPQPQETVPQDDLADVDFILPTETKTNQEVATSPNYINQDQGMPFEEAVYDLNPETTQVSPVTFRSLTSQVMRSPVLQFFSSTTPTTTQTENGLLRDGVEIIQKAFRTRSTYPFFPGGCTPKKDPEPTEITMCGIAKCLQLKWSEDTLQPQLQYEVTENRYLMKRPNEKDEDYMHQNQM